MPTATSPAVRRPAAIAAAGVALVALTFATAPGLDLAATSQAVPAPPAGAGPAPPHASR